MSTENKPPEHKPKDHFGAVMFLLGVLIILGLFFYHSFIHGLTALGVVMIVFGLILVQD